jgi:3-isopropylmalate dehydrogenase
MKTFSIAVLAGDGIGPEVMQQARKVLDAVSLKHNFSLDCKEYAVGGYAIDTQGEALPKETLNACENADAIYLARLVVLNGIIYH